MPKGNVKDSSASQGLACCNLPFEIAQVLAEKTENFDVDDSGYVI